MSEQETKIFFNRLEKLLTEDEQHPVCSGGLKRPVCRSCGGSIYESRGGVRRMMCSECGKPYYEPRFA